MDVEFISEVNGMIVVFFGDCNVDEFLCSKNCFFFENFIEDNEYLIEVVFIYVLFYIDDVSNDVGNDDFGDVLLMIIGLFFF